MSYPMNDLTGKVFGRLTVLHLSNKSRPKNLRWICKCIEGNIVDVLGRHLKKGNIKSCGCLQRERAREANTKHGQEHTKLYEIWCNMKRRCTDPTNDHYIHYGGRGIAFCPEWNAFIPFSNWANTNGYKIGLELERKDNNLGYNPHNCTWVTRSQNQRNKRTNRKLEAFGEVKTMIEWSEDARCVVNYTALQGRLKLRWPVELALTKLSRLSKN